MSKEDVEICVLLFQFSLMNVIIWRHLNLACLNKSLILFYLFIYQIFPLLFKQGRFEILTLSGSCTYTSGAGGAQRKVAMLSVSLAKPDGRVFGGGVENSLIAATPIQVRNFFNTYEMN